MPPMASVIMVPSMPEGKSASSPTKSTDGCSWSSSLPNIESPKGSPSGTEHHAGLTYSQVVALRPLSPASNMGTETVLDIEKNIFYTTSSSEAQDVADATEVLHCVTIEEVLNEGDCYNCHSKVSFSFSICSIQ